MSDDNEHGKKKHKSGGHGHGGGGSHEEHEGAPEWLISFADNVTLMMGFFVLLLAMNLKPAGGGTGEGQGGGGAPPTPELLDVAIAVREAMNNPVNPGSTNPIDLPLIERLQQRSGDSEAVKPGPKGREHDVKSIRPSTHSGAAGVVPFADGGTELTQQAITAIGQIIPQVRGLNLVVEIKGHVSAAESFEQPDRAMKLSFDRARSVAEALASEGVRWSQMRLIACADAERLIPTTYDATGHGTNQRVEVIVTDQISRETLEIEELHDNPKPSEHH